MTVSGAVELRPPCTRPPTSLTLRDAHP
jgi:hypothetical protein